MKHTDLPSPGLISQAGALRNNMAQAISYVQTMAKYSATGKSKHAKTLATFLTAAQVAVAQLADSVVPDFVSGSVNGSIVRLVYSEDLSATGVPLPAAFAVLVATVARAVTDVSVGGNTVTLTLATPVVAAQAVTVAYAVPTPVAQKLQDASGNFAVAKAAGAVTNTTV